MDPWAIVLIAAAISVCAAIGVLYALPATRPFIKTWWPAFVVIAVSLLVLVLVVLGRRGGSVKRDDPLDKVIEGAKESIIDAKLEAEVKKREATWAHDQVTTKLEEINQSSDVFDRHLRKRMLLEKARQGP